MKQNECKWFSACPMKHYWEQEKLDSIWIEAYCKSNWKKCIRFFKEENGIFHPDNMLPNGEIDKNLK